jgi:hypothetical protein
MEETIAEAAALLRANGWRVEEPPVTDAEKLSRKHRDYLDGWRVAQFPAGKEESLHRHEDYLRKNFGPWTT